MAISIQIENVTKEYQLGEVKVQALKGISFQIHTQDFVAFAGSSGSGKSTLLNLIGCLDNPTSGQVLLDQQDTKLLSEIDRTELRLAKIGFIFQTFNLLPVLNAIENVEYPLILLNLGRKDRREKAKAALAQVGLEKFAHHRPDQLSGGQRQRVAIARALVKNPSLILADEPTANLDHTTAREILGLMRKLNEEMGVTFVFSTHDQSIISMAKRVLWIQDGQEVEHK